MTERSILFSAPMIRALLAGAKSQTRRWRKTDACPYGGPGDHLWVRETLRRDPDRTWRYAADRAPLRTPPDPVRAEALRAWAEKKPGDTCVSIHLPRAASRLTLVVEAVRVEPLHDISERDALAEGVASRQAYRDLWEHLNHDRAPWDSKPSVWVVTFRRLA